MEQITSALNAVTDKLYGWLRSLVVSLPNLLLALVILAVFWLLARWAYKVVTAIFRKTELNPTLEHLLAGSVRTTVLIIGGMLALSVLQLEKTVFSMLAGVGVVGLALGFAFQDLVSNFISGIMIAVRAPMKVGHVIKIADVMGTVVDLRLRDTVIRNFDGQDIYIPNKSFMTDKFANYSVFGRRQITVAVGVSHESELAKVVEALTERITRMKNILDTPKPQVFAESFNESSVKLMVSTWIKYPGTDPDLARHLLVSEIKKAAEEKVFTLAYPVRKILEPSI